MIKILVIDDEAHVRKLYKSLLEREGFEVFVTDDTTMALELVRDQKIDIVVLDIELENESGLNLLRQYKAQNPNLPIILNTAYSMYMSDFKTWMAEAYILKSSNIQPLIDKIKELTSIPANYGRKTEQHKS